MDKPQGVTSHDVVAAVRSTLRMRRVGHAGTLDPMATGMLVVAYGQATRLLNVIVGQDKTYLATMRLGMATTTDDAEGDPLDGGVQTPQVRRRVADLTGTRLEGIMRDRFTGFIDQVPDAFSAVKVDGRRAYELARRGEKVDLKPRRIHIAGYDLLTSRQVATDGGDLYLDCDVRVTCSSGTYIRALARDLGELLQVGGHLTMLRRTRVGRFDLEADGTGVRALTGHVEAYTRIGRDGGQVTRRRMVLDQDRQEVLAAAMTPAHAARLTLPVVRIDRAQAGILSHGGFLDIRLDGPTAALAPAPGMPEGEYLCALLSARGSGQAKPDVVFASPADE